jgi:hypothetical protein
MPSICSVSQEIFRYYTLYFYGYERRFSLEIPEETASELYKKMARIINKEDSVCSLGETSAGAREENDNPA